MCFLSVDECTRAAPYNITKKVIKTSGNTPSKAIHFQIIFSVNASEKESVPEKSIESFDEWTKKRRDAVAVSIQVFSTLS